MELQGLHGHVVDRIGWSLLADELRAGDVLRLEDVQARFAVSRTVAREAVRVLESKRVVTSRPRVGITVRPMNEWNLYDPHVIRWRLSSPRRRRQLRELAELRAAVEPSAAALAASRADDEARRVLRAHTEAMAAAVGSGDAMAFVAADVAFHRALLAASGNGMFAQLADVTEELLYARREFRLMPDTIDMAAVDRHRAVVTAISEGRAADASHAVATLVDAARSEVEELLTKCGPKEDPPG